MSTVGFVGIGAMGEPMVANLLKKGFGVTVLKHRREEPANRLHEQGAKVVTAAVALADSEVIVMRSECDNLILQHRIRSRHHADHVVADPAVRFRQLCERVETLDETYAAAAA